jgi:glycosyltransferase involved in cell wall biosynthesis
MKVLQLIDSLDIGGAERMSVNLANALAQKGMESFLCATRKGGALEAMVDARVNTLILHKKSAIDVMALYRLVRFIKKNGIDVIHAHSSSFFTAVLVKPLTGVRIVWHDHYGNAELLETRPVKSLRYTSRFFDAVISVNEKLAAWSRENLQVADERVVYLPNFADLTLQNTQPDLPGTKETRIVCLANLREQKDHLTLLKAFKMLREKEKKWHLLLVGEDREDAYSAALKTYIQENGLQDSVHILGSRSDSTDILLLCTIGVLSSVSEGLPVALLEYGLAKLPVVCTDVGQCGEVLGGGKYGRLVPPHSPEAMAEEIGELVGNAALRERHAADLFERIHDKYSEAAVVDRLMKIYKGVMNV